MLGGEKNQDTTVKTNTLFARHFCGVLKTEAPFGQKPRTD